MPVLRTAVSIESDRAVRVAELKGSLDLIFARHGVPHGTQRASI